MAMAGAPGDLTVHLERTLPALDGPCTGRTLHPRSWRSGGAPRDSVPRASSSTCGQAADIELRCNHEGDLFHLSGADYEVEPPRLTYTFRWEEPDPDDRETVVTISLEDLGEPTELIVDQGVFATEGAAAPARAGVKASIVSSGCSRLASRLTDSAGTREDSS